MINFWLQRSKLFCRACLLAVLFVASPCLAAVSLQSGYYFEDFNSGVLDPNAWTISKQLNDVSKNTLAIRTFQDGGATHITGEGTGERQVSGTGPSGVTFPLPAIVTPRTYSEFGFSGGWLTNDGNLKQSSGSDFPNGSTTAVRTATLSFSDLAAHTKIDHISFLIASGDTIDSAEGIFEVKLGDTVIFRRDFDGSGVAGTPLAGYSNVSTQAVFETLIKSANLKSDGYYRESWTGTSSVNDRQGVSWTLDGAHRVTFTDLAHTGSTLDLTFVWYGMNGDYLDEYIAIDNLLIVVPEPSRAILASLALGLMILRRKRNH